MADEFEEEVGNNGGNVVGVVGSFTFSQRPAAFEFTQHESVAFGELDAQ